MARAKLALTYKSWGIRKFLSFLLFGELSFDFLSDKVIEKRNLIISSSGDLRIQPFLLIGTVTLTTSSSVFSFINKNYSHNSFLVQAILKINKRAIILSYNVPPRLLVFNYLADEEKDSSKPCPLMAAMCICMPWDVSQTSDKLEKSLDWLLFNYPLTHGLRRLVMRNAEVLSEKYDVPRILKVRSDSILALILAI